MRQEECLQCYREKFGKEEPEWVTFYEDTQDERSVFVPGWTFELLSEEGGLLRARAQRADGKEVLVQEEDASLLIDSLEKQAAMISLEEERSGDFLLELLMGRLIGLGAAFDLAEEETGFRLKRDNLEAVWNAPERRLTVLQDGAVYADAQAEEGNLSQMERVLALAEDVSGPAMTSVAQDDLLSALAERYAAQSPTTESHIDLYDDNLCIYRFRIPFGEGKNRVWVAIACESASVGVNDAVLCDDIGLGTGAVCAYVDAFIAQQTVLICTYKNEEAFRAGERGEQEFLPAEGDAAELEEQLAARGRGLLGKLRRGRVLDVISFGGDYDMTVKI